MNASVIRTSATAPDPDGYLLYWLHADVHAGSRVRVWAKFNSGLENGRRTGGPRPVIDEDKLDLHQAFVDVTVGVTGPSTAVLRGGRQDAAGRVPGHADRRACSRRRRAVLDCTGVGERIRHAWISSKRRGRDLVKSFDLITNLENNMTWRTT